MLTNPLSLSIAAEQLTIPAGLPENMFQQAVAYQ
jgi:hypothetical protein